MKKLIALILLSFMAINMLSCFDTDDLFDKVITPDGSVPTVSEDITTIAPTEKPTEEPTEESLENYPTDNSTVEEETYSPDNKAVNLNKTATFTSALITQEDYGVTFDEINSILSRETYDFKMEVSGGIKNAYQCVSIYTDLNNFGPLAYLGPYTFLSIYDGFYAIDGKNISDEYSDLTILVMKFYSSSAGFYSASAEGFENGVLKLNLDYSAMMSGDGPLSIFVIITVEKSFFKGEDLTNIKMVFDGDIFIPGRVFN